MVLFLKRITNSLGFPLEFGRLIKFELQLFFVRFFFRFSPKQLYRIYRFNRQNNLFINFGCGVSPFEGWINIDGIPNHHADLFLDIRRPLPFRTQSARFIFTEHVIEHLRYDEAGYFLSECYRIMKLGGAIRIITPDLKKFVRAYIENDKQFFPIVSPTLSDPVGALNLMFRQGGTHHYIYDFDELNRILLQSGFKKVFQSSFQNSVWPELNRDSGDKQRITESLYVEAVK